MGSSFVLWVREFEHTTHMIDLVDCFQKPEALYIAFQGNNVDRHRFCSCWGVYNLQVFAWSEGVCLITAWCYSCHRKNFSHNFFSLIFYEVCNVLWEILTIESNFVFSCSQKCWEKVKVILCCLTDQNTPRLISGLFVICKTWTAEPSLSIPPSTSTTLNFSVDFQGEASCSCFCFLAVSTFVLFIGKLVLSGLSWAVEFETELAFGLSIEVHFVQT